MSPRLAQITNWEGLAHRADWSVNRLAALCGVSVRTLRRHIRRAAGVSLRGWLLGLRLARARELLQRGLTVKQTAQELGYTSQQAFCRAFTQCYNYPPSQHLARAAAPPRSGWDWD